MTQWIIGYFAGFLSIVIVLLVGGVYWYAWEVRKANARAASLAATAERLRITTRETREGRSA